MLLSPGEMWQNHRISFVAIVAALGVTAWWVNDDPHGAGVGGSDAPPAASQGHRSGEVACEPQQVGKTSYLGRHELRVPFMAAKSMTGGGAKPKAVCTDGPRPVATVSVNKDQVTVATHGGKDLNVSGLPGVTYDADKEHGYADLRPGNYSVTATDMRDGVAEKAGFSLSVVNGPAGRAVSISSDGTAMSHTF